MHDYLLAVFVCLLVYLVVVLHAVIKGLSLLWKVLHRIEARLAVAKPLESDHRSMAQILRDAEYMEAE